MEWVEFLLRGEAALDAEIGAELVEFLLSGGSTLAQAKEAIGELRPADRAAFISVQHRLALSYFASPHSPQRSNRRRLVGHCK